MRAGVRSTSTHLLTRSAACLSRPVMYSGSSLSESGRMSCARSVLLAHADRYAYLWQAGGATTKRERGGDGERRAKREKREKTTRADKANAQDVDDLRVQPAADLHNRDVVCAAGGREGRGGCEYNQASISKQNELKRKKEERKKGRRKIERKTERLMQDAPASRTIAQADLANATAQACKSACLNRFVTVSHTSSRSVCTRIIRFPSPRV